MFHKLISTLVGFRQSLSHDDQIRYFGWALLVIWTLSIIYMTRDFWFPSAFGLPPLSERVTGGTVPQVKALKKIAGSGRDLRFLRVEKMQRYAS